MRHLPLLLLLCAALLLSACYKPLYGSKSLSETHTAQENSLNDIFIAGLDGENGQKLRNLLIDRMYGQGRPAKPSKRLDILLTNTEEHVGLQKNATTTRARLTVTAVYSLSDSMVAPTNGKKLFTSTGRSVVGFDILNEEYATLTSRENAYDRALTEIADMMVNRLLLYFGEGK